MVPPVVWHVGIAFRNLDDLLITDCINLHDCPKGCMDMKREAEQPSSA